MTKININDKISKTLLIPLYYKMKENQRAKKGKSTILQDIKADELVSKINGDYSVYDKDKFSYIGCLFRAKYFDDIVLKYSNDYDELVVINAACGLDSRYERIRPKLNNKNIYFYNTDLDEVISIRKQFFEDDKNSTTMVGDLLDETWILNIKQKHKKAQFLVILEGVLMYFNNENIKKIIHNFSTLKGAYIFADLIGSKMYQKQVKHKTLSKLNIDFQSGINGVDDFVKLLSPDIKSVAIKEDVYFKKHRFRAGFFGFVIGFMPKMFLKKFSSLVGIKLDNN